MKKLILLAALITSTAYAAVYMQEGPNGEIIYSDTPAKNAKKINIPTGNTITTRQAKEPTTESSTEGVSDAAEDTQQAAPAGNYNVFEIISPKNGETITNQPNIGVQMKIEPNLAPTDKVQLMLDDSPVGTATSSPYQELGLVNRGTHTLYAVIIGPQNNIIKQTESITIYVQRTTKILSPTGN